MRVCVLDGRKIEDVKSLHNELASLLEFPDWYGKNLDALHDCLTDLEGETEIRFLYQDILKEHLGDYFEKFIKVIQMSVKDNTGIHLFLQENDTL